MRENPPVRCKLDTTKKKTNQAPRLTNIDTIRKKRTTTQSAFEVGKISNMIKKPTTSSSEWEYVYVRDRRVSSVCVCVMRDVGQKN